MVVVVMVVQYRSRRWLLLLLLLLVDHIPIFAVVVLNSPFVSIVQIAVNDYDIILFGQHFGVVHGLSEFVPFRNRDGVGRYRCRCRCRRLFKGHGSLFPQWPMVLADSPTVRVARVFIAKTVGSWRTVFLISPRRRSMQMVVTWASTLRWTLHRVNRFGRRA